MLKKLNFVPNVDLHGTMGINDKGEIVYGYDPDGIQPFHAWVWLPVHTPEYGLEQGCHDIQDLITLPPRPPDVTDPGNAIAPNSSFARDISESGLVVGSSLFEALGTPLVFEDGEATVWNLRPPRLVRALGNLDAAGWTSGHAIDDDFPPNVVGTAIVRSKCECPYTDSNCQPIPPTNVVFAMRGFRAEVPPVGPISLECLSGRAIESWNAYTLDVVSDPSVSDPDVIGLGVGGGDCFGPVLSNPQSLPSGCISTDTECYVRIESSRWDPGRSTGDRLLPVDNTPDSDLDDDPEARANGINNELIAVGMARFDSGDNDDSEECLRRSGLWEPSFDSTTGEFLDHGSAFLLGNTMPTGEYDGQGNAEESRALAIADRDYYGGVPLGPIRVVGTNLDRDTATLWEGSKPTGSWLAYNLNNLIPECSFRKWSIRVAHDVNTNGWIAAVARPCGSVERYAVLLTPIQPCPPDVDRNGRVDGQDLIQVVNSANGEGCADGVICWNDVDLDCDVDVDDVVEVFLAISRDCIYFLGNPASHGGPDTVTIDWIANLFADDPDGLAMAIEAWLIALEMGDP